MKKKEKIGKLKKKIEKKKKKKEKREKLAKKKIGRRITVDYCCNPQWNVWGGTVIPPHHLEYCTSYMTCAMPRVNGFYIKNIKKKLRSKNIRFFYKAIPKSLGCSCNAWPKSNIYNINNNIKLAWPKFKWVWLQYQTQ